MKFNSPRLRAFLAAIALTLLLAVETGARPRREEVWMSVQSRNFLLVGNAREGDLRKVAARLEQFRETFLRILPVERLDSTVPVTVLVFRDDESYRPFVPLYQGQPAEVSGFFQSSQDVDYITLSVDPKHTRDADALAFHEYVHLLVRNSFRNAPLWFNEGLAEYYSTFEISGGNRRVTLGKPVATRVQALQRATELIPLEKLLSVSDNSEYYHDKYKRHAFYAESWALVHYLLSGSRRAELSTYLDLMAKGTSVEEAFRQAFQTDFRQVESELLEYIRFNRYPQQTITFDRGLEFDTVAQSSVLAEAEAEFYLGDLLLHTNRLEEAEAYLQKAVALDPDLSMAWASLGMLRLRQNRLDEARQNLETASRKDSTNHLIHYYHAYVLSREGAGSDEAADGYYDSQKTALLRSELKRAIELAPRFAEAYRLLAFVNLVRGEQLEESIALVKKAMELSPRRDEFAFLLAQIHLRRDEFGAAREILQALVGSGPSAQVRTQAQSLLASVSAREEFLARVRVLEEAARKEKEEEETPPPGPLQPCDAPQPGAQLKRLRFQGEQVCGMLVQVKCGDGGVTLFVESGGRTLKLHSERLGLIRFVTYTAEVRGQVTCGLRSPANAVLVTYRPATRPDSKVDGEVIAVEFVPRDWNANH